jgi:hypothetical protein
MYVLTSYKARLSNNHRAITFVFRILNRNTQLIIIANVNDISSEIIPGCYCLNIKNVSGSASNTQTTFDLNEQYYNGRKLDRITMVIRKPRKPAQYLLIYSLLALLHILSDILSLIYTVSVAYLHYYILVYSCFVCQGLNFSSIYRT